VNNSKRTGILSVEELLPTDDSAANASVSLMARPLSLRMLFVALPLFLIELAPPGNVRVTPQG
jgi:hypothetical protein